MSGGLLLISSGRGAGTRTQGLVVPNDARYQTAPRPDVTLNDAKLLYHRVALGVVSVPLHVVLPAVDRRHCGAALPPVAERRAHGQQQPAGAGLLHRIVIRHSPVAWQSNRSLLGPGSALVVRTTQPQRPGLAEGPGAKYELVADGEATRRQPDDTADVQSPILLPAWSRKEDRSDQVLPRSADTMLNIPSD